MRHVYYIPCEDGGFYHVSTCCDFWIGSLARVFELHIYEILRYIGVYISIYNHAHQI